MRGLSNFEMKEVFNRGQNEDLLKHFVGVFPSDKMNKYFDFEKMMKSKKYPFLIANTDRSDEKGTHWRSILDIDGKKILWFLILFGIKALKKIIIR